MGRLITAIFKFKPFSKKQLKILTWWLPNSPMKDKDGIIADGAIRSGKTLSMSLSFVMWAMQSFDCQNLGMCGKTIGSFRRNVVFTLKIMLKSRGYKVHDNRTENLLTITFKGKTNYFYIFGGKDERSQDLIQGITLAGVLFDEVALMPQSFVNQATGRCSVDGSKFWFNCNPDGPFHWFKAEWIDKAEEKNMLYLHFLMDDNLSLSEETKQRYKTRYSGVFFSRFILGLWVAAEGIIYDMFDKDKHTKSTADKYTAYYVSCDYGTQNATVFLLWGKNPDGSWTCIKEYYYSGRDKEKQKTDEEYVKDLKDFIGNIHINSIVVDPSAASFIASLNKSGFKVQKAKNDVLDGIRFTAMCLNTGKIFFTNDCENTLKEFGSYVWDEKAVLKGEDKPIKVNDHAMDATRYFCYTVINKNVAKAYTGSIRI